MSAKGTGRPGAMGYSLGLRLRPQRSRHGFALLVALLAIALVTALLVATALRVDQDRGVARAETLQQRAFAGAEVALWQAVIAADAPTLRSEPIGTTTASQASVGDLTTDVRVTKVDTTLVWLTVDAQMHRGVAQAHRRLGLSATVAADPTDPRLHPVPGWAWVELF